MDQVHRLGLPPKVKLRLQLRGQLVHGGYQVKLQLRGLPPARARPLSGAGQAPGAAARRRRTPRRAGTTTSPADMETCGVRFHGC